jgi:hypothetical protein
MTAEQPPENDPQQPTQVNLTIRPEVAEGLYANFANASQTLYEFNLDFANINFVTATGAIVARIAMSPILAQQLHSALGAQLDTYAQRLMAEQQGDQT